MLYFALILLCYPALFVAKALRRRNVNGDRRFLVHQTAKIGDLVCTSHVFRAIKKKYPDAHLAVIVSGYTEPMLRNNPRVDDIIVLNTQLKGLHNKLLFARRLLVGSYDTAIILIPNPAFVFMATVALIPHIVTLVPDTIGVTQRAISLFCKRVKHYTGSQTMEAYLRALELIGIDSGDLGKEAFFTKEDEEKALQFMLKSGVALKNDQCVGLVISAANKMKALKFNMLLYITENLVRKFNTKVVLLGTTADAEMAGKIIQTLGHHAIVDACGYFSLSELPALISTLDLVIGVDTGPMYIAHAVDVPVIVIAGPCDMGERWTIGGKVKVIKASCSCAPCSYTYLTRCKCKIGDRVCLTDIDGKEILSACLQLL